MEHYLWSIKIAFGKDNFFLIWITNAGVSYLYSNDPDVPVREPNPEKTKEN